MSKTYNVVVLPGDGIGPEVTAQAARVLELISEKSKDFKINLEKVSQTHIRSRLTATDVYSPARRKTLEAQPSTRLVSLCPPTPSRHARPPMPCSSAPLVGQSGV